MKEKLPTYLLFQISLAGFCFDVFSIFKVFILVWDSFELLRNDVSTGLILLIFSVDCYVFFFFLKYTQSLPIFDYIF